MSSMEALRRKLYSVWEKGSSNEILRVSQELDVEIAKYMKRSLASQNQLTNVIANRQNLFKK